MRLLFFPKCIIKYIIRKINKKMEVGLIYGEFLCFIGIIFFGPQLHVAIVKNSGPADHLMTIPCSVPIQKLDGSPII